RRLAGVIARGAAQIVFINGEQSPAYDGVVADSIHFSPDSKRVAYGAKRGATRGEDLRRPGRQGRGTVRGYQARRADLWTCGPTLRLCRQGSRVEPCRGRRNPGT